MKDQDMIPTRIKAALDNYAERHWKTGDFCRAVLANDLSGAVLRADDESLAALPEIVRYVINELPPECHGSRATVDEWLDDLPDIGDMILEQQSFAAQFSTSDSAD